MTPVLRLAALGSQVEVKCLGERADVLAAAMREAWSRCLVDEEASRRENALQLDVHLEVADDLARRLMLTTQTITRALVGAQRGHLVMLHAGAVSHPVTGASLVFVAPGGTGKTTMCRLLGARFGYLTDETVGIDDSHAIVPYPKPLSVRRPEGGGPKDEVSPDALGLLPAPAAPVASRIVLLDRQSGSSPPQLEEVSFMDALFALTEQTSSLSALPRPLHRLESLIDAAGPVLRVRYAEASAVEHDLAALIGGAP